MAENLLGDISEFNLVLNIAGIIIDKKDGKFTKTNILEGGIGPISDSHVISA